MTDRRSNQDEIEKLKRTNRRRLAGASAMVLVAGILLAKAWNSDSREQEVQTVSMASAEYHSGQEAVPNMPSAAASDVEVPTEKQSGRQETAAVSVHLATDSAPVPIDRLSDEELVRIIEEDAARHSQTGSAGEAETVVQPSAAGSLPVGAVSFPKMPDKHSETEPDRRRQEQEAAERRLKERKEREAARRKKDEEERRKKERTAEEAKRAAQKKADEERRLQERRKADAAKADAQKREQERRNAEKKESVQSKVAEAERRAAELRKQAAEAERRAAELKKQAESKRRIEEKKSADRKTENRAAAKSEGRADKERKANIQAGAFRDIEQAKQMKKRLNDAGIIVDITTVNTDKGKVYRVRTGSYPNRAAAERALTRLKEKGINGKVIDK
ncbi:MAG: SPOR domain-containing protein [Neisseria sp.]|nr:SPOR domain-containing protein [Neisseria sp.]